MANETFDPTTLTHVTLSPGNLTATHSATSSDDGARIPAISNYGTGKYYFEVTIGAITGSQSSIGIVTAAGTYANIRSGSSSASVYQSAGGVIWSNDGFSGYSLGNLANGDVIGVAVDLVNKKIWFRKAPSGNWNGDASANPATGVNGASLSSYAATTLGPAVQFGGSATDATENFTANFGDSGFTGTVPSGFTSGWPVFAPAVFETGGALLFGL